MKTMFYVKVKFSHSYHYESNHSKTFEDITSGIIGEVRAKVDKVKALFDMMGFMTTFFILFMVLRYSSRALALNAPTRRSINREAFQNPRLSAEVANERSL